MLQTPNHSFPRKAAISASHGPGAPSGRRDTAADRAEPGCAAPPAWVRTSPAAPRQRARAAAAQTRCRPRGHGHTEDCTDVPTSAPGTAQDWRPERRSAVLSGPGPVIPCAAGKGRSPAARQSPCKQVPPSSEKGEQPLAGEPDLPLASRRATLARCGACGGPKRWSVGFCTAYDGAEWGGHGQPRCTVYGQAALRQGSSSCPWRKRTRS